MHAVVPNQILVPYIGTMNRDLWTVAIVKAEQVAHLVYEI